VKKPKMVKLYEKGLSNADMVKVALESALIKHEEIKADRCIVILDLDASENYYYLHGGDMDELEALWIGHEYVKKLIDGELTITND